MILQTYDLLDVGTGPAILLVGMLGILLFAGIQFRNPAALVLWAVTLVLFVFSGLFGIGFELVWMAIAMTGVIIVIGVVARWTQ